MAMDLGGSNPAGAGEATVDGPAEKRLSGPRRHPRGASARAILHAHGGSWLDNGGKPRCGPLLEACWGRVVAALHPHVNPL